jgi:hypothetical protein
MRYFVVVSLASRVVRCVIQADSLLEAKQLVAQRFNDPDWQEYLELTETELLSN